MLCSTPDLRIQDNPYITRDDGTISSPELVFYLGFTLDGVETYTNISEAEGLEQYGILTVYPGPSLDTADGVITYQEGVPLHVNVSRFIGYDYFTKMSAVAGYFNSLHIL